MRQNCDESELHQVEIESTLLWPSQNRSEIICQKREDIPCSALWARQWKLGPRWMKGRKRTRDKTNSQTWWAAKPAAAGRRRCAEGGRGRRAASGPAPPPGRLDADVPEPRSMLHKFESLAGSSRSAMVSGNRVRQGNFFVTLSSI